MKPNNIDVKIGTPEQAFWNSQKARIEQQIKLMQEDLEALPKLIELNKELVGLIERKIGNPKKSWFKR